MANAPLRMAIGPDGSIVVLREASVVRFEPDGNRDQRFGQGGRVKGGQPLADVGSETCPRSSRVIRLGADGTPLAGFGVNGARTYPRLQFSLLQPSGAMLLRAGPQHPRLLEVRPNGNLDNGFGKNGSALLPTPPGGRSAASVAGVDSRGRILLVGSATLPSSQAQPHSRHAAYLNVGRILASGERDLRLGKHGWVTTRIIGREK